MFQIIKNVPFKEKEGDRTYYGKQLMFLGVAIADKYYTFSEKETSDGFIERFEYLRGERHLINVQKTYQKLPEGGLKPAGKWMYYTPDEKNDTIEMRLYQTQEYDDNGNIKEEYQYSYDSYKILHYGKDFRVECYNSDNQLISQTTQKDDEIKYEKFSYDGQNKTIHIRTTKGKSFLSELCVTSENGIIIDYASYIQLPNGLFIKSHRGKDEKTNYSLLERCYDASKNNDADCYLDSSPFVSVDSKKTLYQVIVQMRRLQNAEDKKRQNAIALIRKASSLNEKKAVVLAFRTNEKIR